MTTSGQTSSSGPPAGGGRLAQLIATRGGQAAPEAPFVIEHREALIYMLCEAAELEHGIMCQYLFAAFSLKQSAAEGLTGAELDAVTRWRKQVSHVATQEMLHLALVQNLLSAIGAAPHMSRPNLPLPAEHYPAGVQLALLPFGEQALRHFMFLERPEGMDLADVDGLAAIGRAEALMSQPRLSERDIVPRPQDFATVGHLYRSIEAGFGRLADKYGADWLFVGPPRAQATQTHFRWPELVAVTDLASAQHAIDTILEQGEGPRGHWRNAHFGQFVEILDEYEQLREANPDFDPVRPVMAANVRQPERDIEVPLITDLLTARVTDLFNVGYEILLQIFERYFAHTEETDAQLAILADATIALMLRVIKPLGDLITTLPVGAAHPSRTAGPSFELFYETDYLMPHREAAWALLAERLDEAVWLCTELQVGRGTQIADQLEPCRAALAELAQTLAAQLAAQASHARLAAIPADLAPAELAALLARASDLARKAGTAARDDSAAAALAELFDAAYAATTIAAGAVRERPDPASGPGSGTAHQAVPRLVDSVLRPLADALARFPAREPQSLTPVKTEVSLADAVWTTARTATELRARLGAAAVPELIEAVAALQDLACRLVAPREAAGRLAELGQIQAGLPAMIQTARNGPYLVTNVSRLQNYLGESVETGPTLALCRCGGSAIKPRCDGTHARTGFSDEKDPKHVPDRRDTYDGQQVTIFDNRGTCQHAGFCTDRLATVFRQGAEPFVTPSGGRMDEIMRAVRDCPSGALSLAIGGREAREYVDWDGAREPTIEITKDGPYRVRGRVGLTDPDGTDVARNEGASREHYALCRCGQSQNKPFCSGMHWYVDFRDPPPPARDPNLFEWAGGLPALTRMTRLLYEKLVPADPLLAPLFATMTPSHPEQVARRLGEAFGGPDADPAEPGPAAAEQGDTEQGRKPRTMEAFGGQDLTEEQRARWVARASQAAREAGLPADPEFLSAFTGYIEWGSATALENSKADAAPHADAGGQGDAVQPAHGPAPRWDWGPAGPPRPRAQPAATEEKEKPVTLPGPGQPVSFAAHIKPLFRERDQQSMSFAFDLWSYDDVKTHAPEILTRLAGGSMPCDGAWPDEQVQVFRRWTETGTQP